LPGARLASGAIAARSALAAERDLGPLGQLTPVAHIPQVDENFVFGVDGEIIATERREAEPGKEFIVIEYPLAERPTAGRSHVLVRFETRGSDAPVYERRMLAENGTA
jgi:hypothetical protein